MMAESLYNRFCDALNSGEYADNFIMSLPSHVRDELFPDFKPKPRTQVEHPENKT
ncbi:hypothetical protein GGR96_001701 [Thalassospira tepidiphila]|uniref:Uncharacterized protein n=1 Tax=Thalassospira tepidiphila TaxID=393657 RepID=A0ABX0WZ67_9PROT|nr:hypothetical protein [Thalassospira tepidiphila]